jgi:hypothetical protein
MRKVVRCDERKIVIDIVGDSLMNGSILVERLREAGIIFYDGLRGSQNSQINEFIKNLIENEILMYNPDVDEVSSDMIYNDYCLTKTCLREYKINKLGI